MNLITSNPSEIESRLQDLKDGKSSPSQFSILKIRNPGPSYPLISQPNTVGKPFKLPTETVHFSSILKMSSTRYGWEGLPCYSTDQKSLQEWAWKTIHWTNQTCGWTTKNNVSSSSPPFDQGSIDLRLKKQLDGAGWYFRRYPQLFEAKHGFVSGCSILDSLFIMGPDELNRQLDQLVALHSS